MMDDVGFIEDMSSSSRWSSPSPRDGASSYSSSNGGSGRGRGTASHPQRDTPISTTGFSMARRRLGHTPDAMTLLESPSRGLNVDHDENSLKNPAIQERFRQHITKKLIALNDRLPKEVADRDEIVAKQRREELSIVLLDFRKLREGIRSIRRVDEFAAEVYESSARYSIYVGNYQQLGSCLPHLIFDLYPLLVDANPPSLPLLSSSLASLSITGASTTTSVSLADRQIFYTNLYLLYIVVYLEELTSFNDLLRSLPSSHSPSSSTTSPSASSYSFSKRVYTAINRLDYVAFERILAETENVDELQIILVKSATSKMRERTWMVMARSYKVFTDLEWIAKVLFFGQRHSEAKSFLIGKGIII